MDADGTITTVIGGRGTRLLGRRWPRVRGEDRPAAADRRRPGRERVLRGLGQQPGARIDTGRGMVRGPGVNLPYQWISPAEKIITERDPAAPAVRRSAGMGSCRAGVPDPGERPIVPLANHEAHAGRDLPCFLRRLDADAPAAQFPGEERLAMFLFEELRRGIDERRPFADQPAVVAQLRRVGGRSDGRVGECEERADGRRGDEARSRRSAPPGHARSSTLLPIGPQSTRLLSSGRRIVKATRDEAISIAFAAV